MYLINFKAVGSRQNFESKYPFFKPRAITFTFLDHINQGLTTRVITLSSV